jgi:hypothetical protein
MARFLIEVPHEPDTIACAHVVQIFLETGSHFLTNADWGCLDGNHKAWFIVDVKDKNAAREIIPSGFRSQAIIVKLNKWSMKEIDEILLSHKE